MTKALLIAFMLLAARGSAVAQGNDDAHPDCASGLFHRKAIEHGGRHQPTPAEIACKWAVRGRSSAAAGTDKVIADLYEDVMRRSALPERGGAFEQPSGEAMSGGPRASAAGPINTVIGPR